MTPRRRMTAKSVSAAAIFHAGSTSFGPGRRIAMLAFGRAPVSKEGKKMYRTDILDSDVPSTTFDGKPTKFPILACCPRDAMQMAESSEPSAFFPTVTITLTTLLWPGKAS